MPFSDLYTNIYEDMRNCLLQSVPPLASEEASAPASVDSPFPSSSAADGTSPRFEAFVMTGEKMLRLNPQVIY